MSNASTNTEADAPNDRRRVLTTQDLPGVRSWSTGAEPVTIPSGTQGRIDGAWVTDLGQELSGIPRFVVDHNEPGFVLDAPITHPAQITDLADDHVQD